MATYTFEDQATGEQHEYVMSMHKLDEFKWLNPRLKLIIQPNKIIRSHALKPAAGFRSVLKDIKKANRGSDINTFE